MPSIEIYFSKKATGTHYQPLIRTVDQYSKTTNADHVRVDQIELHEIGTLRDRIKAILDPSMYDARRQVTDVLTQMGFYSNGDSWQRTPVSVPATPGPGWNVIDHLSRDDRFFRDLLKKKPRT